MSIVSPDFPKARSGGFIGGRPLPLFHPIRKLYQARHDARGGRPMDETTQATRQPQPPPRTGVTMQRPTIVAGLYLANIVLGFSVFVGLVLAYVWRNDAESQEWERTHFTYLIRTFWIGLAVFMGMFVLWIAVMFGTVFGQAGQDQPPPPAFFFTFFGVIAAWLLGAVWFCIRCILSLVKAGDCKPMSKPRTWLF